MHWDNQKIMRVITIIITPLMISACGNSTPTPMTTVYITKTPQAPSNNYQNPSFQYPDPGNFQNDSSNNDQAVADCMNGSMQLLLTSNDLRDQSQKIRREAGVGMDANQDLLWLARDLENQSREMRRQYQNALANC